MFKRRRFPSDAKLLSSTFGSLAWKRKSQVAIGKLKLAAALGFVVMSNSLNAKVAPRDPDLPTTVFNYIADVCIAATRGNAPNATTAGNFLLEPLSSEPAALGGGFANELVWFRSTKKPESVFIGIGKSNSCNIFIADTDQTNEVQKQIAQLLISSGFLAVAETTSANKGFNDVAFVKEAADGYLLVGVQGPLMVIGDGSGLQAEVHVRMMSKAMFNAMRATH